MVRDAALPEGLDLPQGVTGLMVAGKADGVPFHFMDVGRGDLPLGLAEMQNNAVVNASGPEANALYWAYPHKAYILSIRVSERNTDPARKLRAAFETL